MTKSLGIIPARYKSVRFPGKLLADAAGKSLIRRTYENARNANIFDHLIVATDDERIADEIRKFGGEVELTSAAHLSGSDRIAEVIRKRKDLDSAEIIFNIQGDEPDVEPETFRAIIDALSNDPKAVVGTAAKQINNERDALDSSVVKCVIAKDGRALYFSRALIPYGRDGTFHEETTYYHHLGLYAYRRDFLLHYSELKPTPLQLREDLEQLKILENGYAIQVAVVESSAHGIDTPEDLQRYKEQLCKKNTSS